VTDKKGAGLMLAPFFKLSKFETIGSTNTHARQMGDDGLPEGQVVWSLRQESGVGRRGRQWTSPEGNLYCSILLRPKCTMVEAARLSFLVAIALHRALREFVPQHVPMALKWPNDLLVDGHKIAGILLESKSGVDNELQWLVIGTGVNVANFPKTTEGLPATSIAEVGGSLDVEAIFIRYTEQFLYLYKLWEEKGFAPIREEWLKWAVGRGKPVKVRLADREFSGIFEDLDPSGALVLTMDDGSKKLVTAGEVFFVSQDNKK
jgi:BirA family transcriptional regulator, biotin operon repressor / biotin---[acetyl-CoA-carboxylase] ligase